jgi:hypothetical protein
MLVCELIGQVSEAREGLEILPDGMPRECRVTVVCRAPGKAVPVSEGWLAVVKSEWETE